MVPEGSEPTTIMEGTVAAGLQALHRAVAEHVGARDSHKAERQRKPPENGLGFRNVEARPQ